MYDQNFDVYKTKCMYVCMYVCMYDQNFDVYKTKCMYCMYV